MAGPRRQPAREANKDDGGVTTSRAGSPRDDSQRADHADHGEPLGVTSTATPSPTSDAESPAEGRQPQRPGQDARFKEQPGSRDHVTGTSLPTAPKKR
jgi:hypothetical protein